MHFDEVKCIELAQDRMHWYGDKICRITHFMVWRWWQAV